MSEKVESEKVEINKPDYTAKITDTVHRFFVESNDFNGIQLRELADEVGLAFEDTIEIVKQLVEKDIVTVQAGPNPHIITFFGSVSKQLEVLDEAKSSVVRVIESFPGLKIVSETLGLGVYPTKSFLSEKFLTDLLETKPFTRMLSLGHSQLEPLFFDIEVLERYAKDPRYKFQFHDYSGGISYEVDDNENPLLRESDQVFLKTFGLGKDKDDNRVAVAFLRYLHNLTPEHQLYWRSYQNNNECRMYDEYYKNSIEGNWSTSCSVFSGYLQEQETLNEIVKVVYGVPLFNQTFASDKRPDNFHFLFIPTLKNYHEFILTLDKITSDNINKHFFGTVGIAYETLEMKNGKTVSTIKGTLAMLHEWLEREITITEGSISALMQPFKDVRKERQVPAHRLSKNTFDKTLIEKQDRHIWAAYSAMRNLRDLFQKHPNAAEVTLPRWLDENGVKDF